jgi:hypothetical protein
VRILGKNRQTPEKIRKKSGKNIQNLGNKLGKNAQNSGKNRRKQETLCQQGV